MESLLSKIFIPKNNSYGLISILERLSVEPHATHLSTLRETRNLLVHSTRIKQSQPFHVTQQVDQYLDDIIRFVEKYKTTLHKQYLEKYEHQPKEIASSTPNSINPTRNYVPLKLIRQGQDNYRKRRIKEVLAIIKHWSTPDKQIILAEYRRKRSLFKSLDQELAEALVEANDDDVEKYR